MGVYIAGMKLPKTCYECPFNDDDYCTVLKRDFFAESYVNGYELDRGKRSADCPMKEVAVLVGGRKIYEDNN